MLKFLRLGSFIVAVLFWQSCKTRQLNDQVSSDTTDIGPIKQCRWNYTKLKDGVAPRFKNASKDSGFDKNDNPRLTVSRRGLTVRVVGTLSDEFMAAYGNDMNAVVADFPYFTPVTQTSEHEVKNGKGTPLGTSVVNLPPNSVMAIYPVAIGSDGHETSMGNYKMQGMVRNKNQSAATKYWGWFPFLNYNGGYAFHGPISFGKEFWGLLRGPVSHGCQRMEGEHIVEMGVMLGCSPTAKEGCPDPKSDTSSDDIRVTVMEEFDYIPNPKFQVNTGKVTSWDEVRDRFIGVDLSEKEFPRKYGKDANEHKKFTDATKGANVNGVQGVRLTMDVAGRSGAKPTIVLKEFPSWDNRNTKRVEGVQCIPNPQ